MVGVNRNIAAQVDRTSGIPLHAQLRDVIKREILSGSLRVGDQVPSDREICRVYQVSRITARRALADLEAEELLVRVPGKGTFVAERQPQSALTHTIGVGLHDPSYLFLPSFSMILSGMAEVATQKGFHVQLIVTQGAPECTGGTLYERVLQQGRIDGLALIDHFVSDEEIVNMHDCGVPIVLCDRIVPGHDLRSVLIDNRGGVFQLVEHLYGLGHSDIAIFIANLKKAFSPARERYEGYRSAIDILGLDFHPEWVIQYRDPQQIEEELSSLINGSKHPTAIICGEDIVAIRIQDLLRKFGYRVPTDFSVVGFDNIPQSAYCVPALTTIDSGLCRIGREMARLLLAEVLSEPVSTTRYVSRAELIVRDSSGSVSQR